MVKGVFKMTTLYERELKEKTKAEMLIQYPILTYSIFLKYKLKDISNYEIAKLYKIELYNLSFFVKHHQNVLKTKIC